MNNLPRYYESFGFEYGASIAMPNEILQFSPRTILNEVKDWFGVT